MENQKTYSYDEAFQTSLKYFDGDELAARVWVSKYAMKKCAGARRRFISSSRVTTTL